MNQWQHPVMIPPPRRLSRAQVAELRRVRWGIPRAPAPSVSSQLAWLGLGYTIAGALFACVLLVLSSGCASADGERPSPPGPSPEAQPVSSEVCSPAPGFIAWESDGLVHVSKHVATKIGGASQFAVTQHYDRTPPFFDVFGDEPMFVGSDLSVCLL